MYEYAGGPSNNVEYVNGERLLKTGPLKGPVKRRAWFLLLTLASILALSACTGRDLISWGSGWSATAVASSADGVVVFVGTRDGDVLALDPNGIDQRRMDSDRNGELSLDEIGQQVKWRFSPEGDLRLGGVFGMPAVGDDFIYVADRGNRDDRSGDDGRLFSLRRVRESSNELQRSQEEWNWPPPQSSMGAIVGGPVLVDGLVMVGSHDGSFYAFEADTGKPIWEFTTDGQIWSSPKVQHGVVYFGSLDSHVYALHTAGDRAGEVLWKFKTGGAVVTTPLLLDGMVIIGSFDKKIYALDAARGTPLWTFEGDKWFWAGPVSDGERIFVASMGGAVYALDKNNGTLIWPLLEDEDFFRAESPIVSTPVLVDDSLVIATDEGTLHLLRAASGVEEYIFLNLGGRAKAPLTRAGDMVFVGVEDGTVRGVNVADWVEEWKVSTKR